MSLAVSSLIIASLVVMLVSLSGVVFIWQTLKHFLEGNLHYLVSFAAGVFLIVSINLGQEALALAPNVFVGVASIFSGFLLMYGLHLIFPESHHHHEHISENCGHDHSRGEAIRVLVSDGIHNIGDGILLAAAFLTSIQLGIITAIGVVIHEMVQEISEFFVLREAGYTNTQALTRNFLVSATILIGALGGMYFVSFQSIIAILLGIAAGGFMYVVVLDLFPQSFQSARDKGSILKFLLTAVVGALLVININTYAHHADIGADEHRDSRQTTEP